MVAGTCVRALIIDANEHMRRLIATILRATPVTETIEARTPGAAMPLVAGHDPRLIVMDWSAEATEEILFVHHLRRRELGGHDTPVLALNAVAHHAVLQQAEDCGIDEMIAKPISAVELITRATSLIEAAERRRRKMTE